MTNISKNGSEQKQNVLKLSYLKARNFFMQQKIYCNVDIPDYISFNPILKEINRLLEGKKLPDLYRDKPNMVDNINHIILHNKDGKYSWRPLQLIHPVLYVSLVHEITKEINWKIICKRFKKFSDNPNIKCMSIPVYKFTNKGTKSEQIIHWWKNTEQNSIKMSLDYEYLIHTDISNCYGSLYTHSVAWAIYGKDEAKKKEIRNDKQKIGNVIDKHLRAMSYGQTNGIPQGSVLMDFIAEMVLGYIDCLLTEKIEEIHIKDYYIIRYRDDYRIFTNSIKDGEKILKCMTEILIGFGMTLNPNKTKPTDQLITGSIKSDKLYWMQRKQSEKDLQKYLLLIHNFAVDFPNSGSLIKALIQYHKKIFKIRKIKRNLQQLISIIVDIAYHNPKTYPISAAIISRLISHIGNKGKQKAVIEKIRKKFSKVPNTGHLDIWLQRIVIGFDESISFNEPICKIVDNKENISTIWKLEWLKEALQTVIKDKTIIDQRELKKITGKPIEPKEIDPFVWDYY